MNFDPAFFFAFLGYAVLQFAIYLALNYIGEQLKRLADQFELPK